MARKNDQTTDAITVRCPLGTGRAMEKTRPGGVRIRVAEFPGVPFLCVQRVIENTKKTPLTLKTVPYPTLSIEPWALMRGLRTIGCDGPATLAEPKVSYAWAAVGDVKTRSGIVAGWLSHDKASGIVAIRAGKKTLSIRPRSEYGKITVPPGETLLGEVLAVGFFDDVLEGLEAYAEAIARWYRIKLPPIPSGYCTWYHAGAGNEKDVTALAKFCKAERLKDRGLDFIQIDDGWQISRRDFTTDNPEGPYPSGMKAMAATIRRNGFTPGIWYTPFGWDHKRDVFKDHQDWFVHKQSGKVYDVYWGGDCFDMTHPGARKFLSKVARHWSKTVGYKYIKIDALWTGVAAKIRYKEPGVYGPDRLGDSVFHNKRMTNIEAFRTGLKTVRKAAGRETFILGCTVAQNMRTLGGSMGLVDGIRVGRDIGARWQSIVLCAREAGRQFFLNGRVWWNDPDCLMLRSPLTLDQARAWGSWMTLSGQMNVVSEFLPRLPGSKLDVLKRTIPQHGRSGRPIDLLENDPARLWHLDASDNPAGNHLVGAFNWNDKRPATVTVALKKLGLPAGKADRYVGFDYWTNRFVAPFTGKLKLALKPSSCRVISLHKLLDRPQVVSTSRHVSQGLVDIVKQSWDPKTNTLTGRSRVVGGDPYEIRIHAPTGFKVKSIRTPDAGTKVRVKQTGRQVRATLTRPKTRQVSWEICFGYQCPTVPAPTDKRLLARLEQGSRDAKLRRGSFVE